MKITPLLIVPVFSLALFLAPSRAAEPVRGNLTPEMQALLADLLKAAAQSELEAVPVPAPATPNAPDAATREAKPPLGSTSSLRISNLAGGSLAPSASLGGRGTTGGTSRLSNNDWRLLFPVRGDHR